MLAILTRYPRLACLLPIALSAIGCSGNFEHVPKASFIPHQAAQPPVPSPTPEAPMPPSPEPVNYPSAQLPPITVPPAAMSAYTCFPRDLKHRTFAVEIFTNSSQTPPGAVAVFFPMKRGANLVEVDTSAPIAAITTAQPFQVAMPGLIQTTLLNYVNFTLTVEDWTLHSRSEITGELNVGASLGIPDPQTGKALQLVREPLECTPNEARPKAAPGPIAVVVGDHIEAPKGESVLTLDMSTSPLDCEESPKVGTHVMSKLSLRRPINDLRVSSYFTIQCADLLGELSRQVVAHGNQIVATVIVTPMTVSKSTHRTGPNLGDLVCQDVERRSVSVRAKNIDPAPFGKPLHFFGSEHKVISQVPGACPSS